MDNFHPWNYGPAGLADRPLTSHGAARPAQDASVLTMCPDSSTPVDNFLHGLCTQRGGRRGNRSVE
ncbi:hypothetical protein GCM10009767_12190 [Kocuria aegyptia]|uniref:Uncharacterized protein n=1 Tax=Kocuria aegyptia TaxID=330943 RepID=A0ABN2KF46_9MICC